MNMALYLIKTACCLAFFYLAYRLLLDHKCHFTVNRIYLIGTFVLSFIIPLITINLHLITLSSIPAGENLLPANADVLPAAGGLPASGPDAEAYSDRINPIFLATILYVAGIMIFAVRYGLDIFRLVRMIRRNRKQHFKDYTLVSLNSTTAPFSFFRYVFVSIHDLASGDFNSFILQHELAHIRAWHSLDRLFLGLGQIIQWFNPITLFYKKAVIALHEFSADHAVTGYADNIAVYQQKMVQYVYEKNKLALTSSFSNTITKKRLTMMTQQNSGRLNAFRVFLAAVVAALLLLAFSSGDKILIKSSPEDPWQDPSLTAMDNNSMPVYTESRDTTANVRPGDDETREMQEVTEDETVRILSDELREMKQEHQPDSIFRWHNQIPLPDMELLQRRLAEEQSRLADRERYFAELQRHLAEQQKKLAEQLKALREGQLPSPDDEQIRALKEGQLRHPDAEQLKKMAEAQARIEALKPLPDEFLRHIPQPEPFIWDERCLRPELFLPHMEDQTKIFIFPHPEQFEHFKHLNEGDKKMMEKQKQWQEKYGREMEKQQKQMEEKRKQLLKEYRDIMKKQKEKE